MENNDSKKSVLNESEKEDILQFVVADYDEQSKALKSQEQDFQLSSPEEMKNSNDNVFNFESNRLLNSIQAAEYLGYKRSYLYNLVSRGLLKPLKCGGRTKGALRFLKSDLDTYLGMF